MSKKENSRHLTRGERRSSAAKMMTEDRLYKWNNLRIWLNAQAITELMSIYFNKQPVGPRLPKGNATSRMLRDPQTANVGSRYKQQFTKSPEGINGSLYFVYGIPRVTKCYPSKSPSLDISQDDSPYSTPRKLPRRNSYEEPMDQRKSGVPNNELARTSSLKQ